MTLLRERERSDDNDARAFLLSNTAEERIEVLGPLHRIAPESFFDCRTADDPAIMSSPVEHYAVLALLASI